MPKGITKTQRILSIYHLFRFCREVSMKELADVLPGACKRTFSRDIARLKMAGVPIRYSTKQRAFILDYNNFVAPELPEGKSERRYIEKLVRLITVMREIPYEDCDKWYMERIPNATKRTMQRDFATLKSIGYEIKYVRSELDVGFDEPINRYYCNEPNGAYGLVIS